jgi:hypothetical protein
VELLFVVEGTFLLEGIGLVLIPGVARDRPSIQEGAPLFLVRPDGTHATALARSVSTREDGTAPRPIAVQLSISEVPDGTRVFGRATSA